MRHLVMVLLGLAFLASPAVANNNYFLPGDAFFSVAVAQADILNWSESSSDTLELSYSRFDGEFLACGNLGYANLTVMGVSADFRSSLAEAYWRFTDGARPLYREEGHDGESVLKQTNSVVAFVYSKDFRLDLPLGLKFNEDWETEGLGYYCGLFTASQPVVLDWKHASEVAPLPVEEGLDPAAHLASSDGIPRTINATLHIKADDVVIILAGFAEQKGSAIRQRCPQLQAIFESEAGSRYMVITKTQIRDFRCQETGAWEESKIQLPVSSRDSRIPKEPLTPIGN